MVIWINCWVERDVVIDVIVGLVDLWSLCMNFNSLFILGYFWMIFVIMFIFFFNDNGFRWWKRNIVNILGVIYCWEVFLGIGGFDNVMIWKVGWMVKILCFFIFLLVILLLVFICLYWLCFNSCVLLNSWSFLLWIRWWRIVNEFWLIWWRLLRIVRCLFRVVLIRGDII